MLLMVDWITGHIEPREDLVGYRPWEDLKGRFDTGKVLRIKPDGETDWITAARQAVVGSHDTSITVRSTNGFNLELSGNPAKFIQGHNLFGSDDALGLYLAAGEQVRKIAGNFPSPGTWGSFRMTGPRFSRLDLTRSYRFPDQATARAWLRGVASTARSSHRAGSMHGAASLHKEGTVYLGKGSERWSFKIYAKADELKARGATHRLLSFLGNDRSELEDWAQGVLRFELQLRGKELVKWPDLGQQSLPMIWQHYYNAITFNRNVTIIQEGLDMADKAKIDNAAAGYLARWKSGEDLRGGLSKTTYKRWRRRLLDAFGVDIATIPDFDAAPVASAELDPAGWDPQPIASKFYHPDPKLHSLYPSN